MGQKKAKKFHVSFGKSRLARAALSFEPLVRQPRVDSQIETGISSAASQRSRRRNERASDERSSEACERTTRRTRLAEGISPESSGRTRCRVSSSCSVSSNTFSTKMPSSSALGASTSAYRSPHAASAAAGGTEVEAKAFLRGGDTGRWWIWSYCHLGRELLLAQHAS